MVTRLRERSQPARDGRRLSPDDEGVSPVVGMIMVLAISIVGISAILYWGLPAIDEMKANVEFRSVQGQFEELDATIKELVAGTTEKTAKRWQPTLNRGQLHVRNNTEPWMFAVETYRAGGPLEFTWASLSDGDEYFRLHVNNSTSRIKVEAVIIDGTSAYTNLNVSLDGVTTFPQQMVDTQLQNWEDSWQTFRVSQSSQPRRLENATFRFRVYDSGVLASESWYAATGRVDFLLEAGLGSKEIFANNGAVFTGMNGAYTMINTPPIPPPTNTTGIHRTFARMITLGGDSSFGGTDTFDLLISLYATATLASYDCAKSDRSDCVEIIQYYNFGTYREPWYVALQNRARGYDYIERAPPAGNADAIKHLEDRRDYQGFTLLESSLKLVGG